MKRCLFATVRSEVIIQVDNREFLEVARLNFFTSLPEFLISVCKAKIFIWPAVGGTVRAPVMLVEMD